MEPQSIREYEQLESNYWWFVGRRKIIENVLHRYFPERKLSILDWGCGPGGNFDMLRLYGSVLGVDSSDEALAACKKKGIHSLLKATDLSDVVIDQKFDLVTSFDVLEHIQEDTLFLRSLKALLKPTGYVLVTVPAFQFLWGRLDEVLGHKRRYSRGHIVRTFESCGYEVLKASYFIFFLSLPFIAYRMLEKISQKKGESLNSSVVTLPRVINLLFTKILSLEAHIIPRVSLPFGTSIILLAKRTQ